MTPARRHAGLVTRLCALAVDSVLLAVTAPVLANGPASAWATLSGQAPGWLKLAAQALAAVAPAAYFSVCWWAGGQTAGGLLFGTSVRRADGRRLGLGRAAARSTAGLLLPFVWLCGLLAILLDEKRRALHDRVFSTVVLRTSASGGPLPPPELPETSPAAAPVSPAVTSPSPVPSAPALSAPG